MGGGGVLIARTDPDATTDPGFSGGPPSITRILIRRYRLLGILVGFGLLIGGLAWLVWPRAYEAQATLLAPKEGTGGGAGSALLLQAERVGLGDSLPIGGIFPGLTRNRDVLVSVLKSQTLADIIIDRFQLMSHYQVKTRTRARKKFWRSMRILVSKEGAITVTVRDREPKLTAEMANFAVDHLDMILNRLSINQAGQNRNFLDTQVQQVKGTLRQAEEALRRFQEKNRAVVLPEQSKVAIEGQARLKGEVLATQTQLEVMRGFYTDADPQVIRLRRKLEELQSQLKRLRGGESEEEELAFPKVPTVALELARLTREMKLQEAVYTILTQQREKARMIEAQEVPTVQILDQAIPPEEPVSPQLGTALGLGAAGGLILGITLAFGLEAWALSRREALGPSSA
jgi:tyrosine-protein kinase Etk/Wzc